MKAKINRSGCISCGLCIEACPSVFQMADDGLAEVVKEDIPKELEESSIEARDGCPVSVIDID